MARKQDGKGAAKGKNSRYGDDVREQAMLLFATTGNINETARTLDIAKSTVHKWIHAPERCEQVEQMRIKKRIEFADKASEIIDKGLLLLDRRIGTALEREEELEQLLAAVAATPNVELSEKQKSMLILKIKQLELQKLGDITTAVGTLFDKRALARGESTSDITVRFGGEIAEWAK